jgi:type I restriction enzyme S subunit
MDDLPNGWSTRDLGSSLISLESGSRPKGGVRGIKDGVPGIGGEHLTYKGTFDFSSIKYVPTEFAGRMNKGHDNRESVLPYALYPWMSCCPCTGSG